LFPYAYKVIRKNSICTFLNQDETLCGNDAVFNQRLAPDGNVATYGKQIEVGAEEKYAPRCWEHFVWPEDVAITAAKIPSCESINGKAAKGYKEVKLVHYY
jgi:thymidine kinase